ncbi:MAG: hypothetical protein DRP64_20440 [Verrucomicrobia bacterium]|nr:MAG: hypothetical protein DRP64_20440 [Verrucomicrobiota bacterium]
MFTTVTVDADGKLYFQNKQLSPAQFKNEFANYICDHDFKYHAVTLRIDGKCQFGDLQPILKILNDAKVTDPIFSVRN